MRSTVRIPLGVAALAVLASLTLAGCGKSDGDTSSAPPSTSTSTSSTVAVNSGAVVDITSVGGKFGYEPADQTVKVGEAVTWVNQDSRKHTVTASPDQPVDFKSPSMATDEEFVQTFATAGTYKYFCSIHGESVMSGTITVTE